MGVVNKKIFLTANIGISVVFLTFAFSVLQNFEVILKMKNLAIAYISITIMFFFLLVWNKLPPIISEETLSKKNFSGEQIFEKNINWFHSLIFLLCILDRSHFKSIFSKKKIVLFKNENDYSFSLEEEKVTLLNGFLDFILILIMIVSSYFLARCIDLYSYKSGLVLSIILIVVRFKQQIVYSIFSVDIKDRYGYKVKVIYPFESVELNTPKLYGFFDPFSKSAIVTKNVLDAGDPLMDYEVAHEIGRACSWKTTAFRYAISIIEIPFLIILPYVLSRFFDAWTAVIPVIIFCFYNLTLGYLLRRKSEFEAESYAVNKIGKKHCIKALKIIEPDDNKNKGILYLIFRPVPVKRRMQFINEYKQ